MVPSPQRHLKEDLVSTEAPTPNKDGLKPAKVKRAANITKDGQTMAVIMFEGDAAVYLGVPAGRNTSDYRAFLLSAGDAVRYKMHPNSTVIDKVEFVFNL